MSGFGFKLKIRYEDKQIEFKPFGNFALVRDEIIKAFGDDVESLVLKYNNLHNKIMFVRNETEYIEMINNFTNELYYPDLEYAELQLVEYVDDDDEAEDVNDDENEIDDDNNNNNNNDDDNDDIDESTRNKHSNKFNEQKRIYYIKEKKEMQREEQRKYELDTNTNTNTNTTNEHSKSKKKSKGK